MTKNKEKKLYDSQKDESAQKDFDTLSELDEACKSCNRCGLHKNVTNVVPGEGSVKAKVMFIGEAPGAKEDKTGRPFVGAAGKFLDELLESISLKRKDVYIANTVKCRPPENRDPTEEEKQICHPWLEAQIKLIDPVIFVPLGKHAFNMFVPDEKISQAHGRVFKSELVLGNVTDFMIDSMRNKIVFAMYHPAVALYNGSMRSILLEDMKGLKKLLDAIDEYGREQVTAL